MKNGLSLYRYVWGFMGSIAFVIILLTLSSCGSSTQLYNQWRDEQYQASPMTSILVIAVKNDPSRRRIWEDGLEQELQKYGVIADPSYRYFPNELPDTQQVIDLLRERNYQGVVTINRLDNETEEYYVPGYVTREPVTRYNGWTNDYYTYWENVRHPGYIESETSVRHRIDLWSTSEGGKMVWSGVGEVVDPTSTADVSKEISNLIVPELAKQNIIPDKL